MRKEVALITGASGGLGSELAKQLQGFKTIILVGRNKANLSAVAKSISQETEVVILPCDLSQRTEIEALAASVIENYKQIDLLINNAGFGEFKYFSEFELDEIDQMFKVNVLGLIYLTRLLAIPMIKSQNGHIINIASMAGKIASSKSTIYSATKFAVIGFSNALRLELAPFGIFVTTVNPGPIATGFFEHNENNRAYLARVQNLALRPEKVAQKIVASVGYNKREINLPAYLECAARLYQLSPKIGDFLTAKVFNFK
ncbi:MULTISPECIES: SDR family oxidoreductase [unclassified Enterococcus]|uniref:SDR family NAD(P)-dependent oxidoreductase n=1 Tax=unclassified Enterococcus TaxID=2608891 RepID=UPI001551749F|nr:MULTISPECIES: SDR family oxidoreductase [unclassified Enterococcus]MBS7576168.1 SDR family oxidoreductase [Enterococcus sp. MMGLQ5-2]MBS7583401.1 SDR family oxidoreductase [Enterococcus sp. MMGLQ5-1]NPD11261.1 SDR family oxidoreductase [Enterococcus sp. MMGLQ5-1]NPD36004.1 SDR family oxidoreductase [Enterococcus sp. MMGLQ5-2]